MSVNSDAPRAASSLILISAGIISCRVRSGVILAAARTTFIAQKEEKKTPLLNPRPILKAALYDPQKRRGERRHCSAVEAHKDN